MGCGSSHHDKEPISPVAFEPKPRETLPPAQDKSPDDVATIRDSLRTEFPKPPNVPEELYEKVLNIVAHERHKLQLAGETVVPHKIKRLVRALLSLTAGASLSLTEKPPELQKFVERFLAAKDLDEENAVVKAVQDANAPPPAPAAEGLRSAAPASSAPSAEAAAKGAPAAQPAAGVTVDASMSEEERKRKEQAATRIQARVRGRQLRTSVSQMKDQQRLAQSSAILVLGPPGMRAATTALLKSLAAELGGVDIILEEVMRDEIMADTRLGRQVDQYLRSGMLLPSNLQLDVMRSACLAEIDAADEAAGGHSNLSKFVVEGFPHTVDQSKKFESEVIRYEKVILLACSLEACKAKVKAAGGDISGLEASHEAYMLSSRAMIAHYEGDGRLLRVSAEGSEDNTYKLLCNALGIKGGAATKDGTADSHTAPAASAPRSAPVLASNPEDDARLKEAEIVFVLGGPGSGKGTQCERIVAEFGFHHLSAGDLLREEVASGSETGVMCATLMKEGKLVPMDVTIQLLRKAMLASPKHKFLIDGFPRALDQADEFEKKVAHCQFVLFFDCPLETMQQRLLKRGETSGRADDNLETIKKRFDTFNESSLPVAHRYEQQGKLRKISAVPPPDEVYKEVRRAFGASDADHRAEDDAKLREAEIVFVLGGPGSGKGTQCERIVAEFGFHHLSAGDLLREEVASGSETGVMCATLMKEGKLVPMDVTIQLLRKAMLASPKRKFLIDGFPRAPDQADEFEKKVAHCQFVLFFDCPLETMQQRLLKRGETSGRADDNLETIKKRFDTFNESSLPVAHRYEQQGKLRKISAVPPPDEVYKEVRRAFGASDAGHRAEDDAKLRDAEIVFVLGGPGSGKGTQCERIVAEFGFHHLSAGDLLREEVASGSETGVMCATLMKEGKLVPMDVTIQLLRKAMLASPKRKFLIDGFPRALDQADEFEKKVAHCQFVLFFDCPLETMQQRLLKRGETSGRADDNLETIKKRFDTFNESSLPVAHRYEQEGKLRKISTVPPPDEVYKEVRRAFGASDAGHRVEDDAKLRDAEIVFVLGGPGSGKGTQCERIVAEFGFHHLSAGDLLREEVASGSETGVMCATLMKEGKLVPMDVTIQLLRKAMLASPKHKFLIDGFPRALDQADEFEKKVAHCQFVLFFDCPLETMQQRLLKRGETSGRADDNLETIKKRFDTFNESSMPVAHRYEQQGKLRKISAVPPPDEVYKEVRRAFGASDAGHQAEDDAKLRVAEIVFVLGGPGSGKGTQCERIVAEFGFHHLSAGDLLREEVASGSETGVMCATLMKEGKLVPMDVTIQLLRKAMLASPKRKFLIDGFPRALDQADEFEKKVAHCQFVLFFDCPLETMQQRLLKRGETSGRADDNLETIKKRFDTFNESSLPVAHRYEQQGKLRKISAVPPPEEVYAEVQVFLAAQDSNTEPLLEATLSVKRKPEPVLVELGVDAAANAVTVSLSPTGAPRSLL
eukprot:jgi/Mesvir1/25772/Mv01945-RA.5